MRTKPVILAFFALATISMQGLLTSCAGDENLSTEKPSTGTQTLKINLKSADTRAAAYADPGTKAENKINRVTIGIFDNATGNVKTIQDAPEPAAPSITTSQLVADDHILVAVNAPAGTFSGALTESDFEKKTQGIDDALAGGDSKATTVVNANLPMFGTGSIVQGGSATAFTAAVDVYHMVAKVTLKSLSVNFLATGAYSAATFTPTAVFMSNVPDKLGFYPVDATDLTNYPTFASAGTLQQGELGNSINLKEYLGTGSELTSLSTIKNKTLSGVNTVTGTGSTYNWGTVSPSVANILYLYTMPSSAATSTRLVIRGDFDPDGAGSAPAVPVYYPVNINYNSSGSVIPDGGTVKQVYPNKNYIIDVTIQGKGSSSPTDAIDPEQATATITVQDFTSANQTNVFN